MIWAAVLLPQTQLPILPVRTEVVAPIRNVTFDKEGKARRRVEGGNPRTVDGILIFDGAQDGNRQVDPQIAVGGGKVLHATNLGLTIYSKEGEYLNGVPQSEFNGGIDPKLFFDPINRVFGFDLWNPWDDEKKKPVNISVSETSDPEGAWNTYPVPAPDGVDGGAIGHSREWIGYTFPGGTVNTFVLSLADAKAGRPATVYHFAGNLGQPVFTQDNDPILRFVRFTQEEIIITGISSGADGKPQITSINRAPHNFTSFAWPPESPMKGTEAKTASGDRNPKVIALQNGKVWFSQTVNIGGRAAVQWNVFEVSGKKVQSGVMAHGTNSYIQTTMGVNKRGDAMVGWQETGPDMHISARMAWRMAGDRDGALRGAKNLIEGLAPTEGGSWGDYSGTTVDGDNMLDLWTVQSFANAQGRGGTVIARVLMPDSAD